MVHYRQKTFEIVDFAIKKSLFDHPTLRSSPAVGEDFFYNIDNISASSKAFDSRVINKTEDAHSSTSSVSF